MAFDADAIVVSFRTIRFKNSSSALRIRVAMYSMTIVPFAMLAIPAVAATSLLLGIAVPVLIHMLYRQRVRVVAWAAMRFLTASKKKHRRQIDRWFLLAARILCLLLPLTAMVAATPWAEQIWQAVVPGVAETMTNSPRTHHILLVDCSLSMTAKAETRTRFDLAIDKAEKSILAANPGDGFTLIALSGQSVTVVPGPSNDTEKVLAELRNLKPTHGLSDVASGLAQTVDVLNRSPRNYLQRDVRIFTDLQRVAWSGLLSKADGPTPEVWTKITNRSNLIVVDVADGEIDNLAIAELTVADPVSLVNEPATVTAIIDNFGSTARTQVRVELLLGRPGDGAALLPLETRTIDRIAANDRATIRFALDGASRFRQPGLHALQVRLVEADDLPADDLRTLVVDVREGLNCLIVNGKNASEPLRRASEYLTEALAPGGKPLPGNPARPKVISLDEFADATFSDFTPYDCVFLCDVPTITPSQIARLEGLLKRGGSVVFGLGPNAATNAELYNRLLFADGNGLLPGKLGAVKSRANPQDPGFRLFGDDDAFRRAPLNVFQDDNARAGLIGVPFSKYIALDLPEGRGRRILSFVEEGKPKPDDKRKPDVAVVEWQKHRGKVVVYASTFNAEWNEWPILPSYLPFVHELLRYVVANPTRRNYRVGDAIEEYVGEATVGSTATLTLPNGTSESATVAVHENGGVVRFPDTHLGGLYRLAAGPTQGSYLAANVPETIPGGGSESDLRRINSEVLKAIHPTIQVVREIEQIVQTSSDGTSVVVAPKPHGPLLARIFVLLALAAFAGELILAWRLGPARSAVANGSPPEISLGIRWSKIFGWPLLFVAAAVIATSLHGLWSGEFLSYIPQGHRHLVERVAGLPAAEAGEGTRWRLESSPALSRSPKLDHRLLGGLALFSFAIVVWLYRNESRATAGWRSVALPAGLRLCAYLLAIVVLLPQLRIAFDREGWPDIAILIDDSASMAHRDDLRDPAIRAKADELAKMSGVELPQRIELAKWLLLRPDCDWLTKLLVDKQWKVHLFAVSDQTRFLASANDAKERATVAMAINDIAARGESSRLGDGVRSVLKTFRGSSLAAVIVLTDGVTTAGDDLPKAGREAAQAGVPLYLVGFGEANDPLDLSIGDLRSEDMVVKNDELLFEARLSVRGVGVPKAVRATLSEKVGDAIIPLDEANIVPDATGKPVAFRLRHTPTQPGERTYIIEVPTASGEAEIANNRIERQVVVTENPKIRVLYVEGYPRYEFRFLKVLLEREVEPGSKWKSIELSTLLLDASNDYATTDRSAIRSFPTRSELFDYDVVILGDFDPSRLPHAKRTVQDLTDFVKQRGGGLLLIAGEHASPSALFATTLAAVLPIAPVNAGADVPAASTEEKPIPAGYRLQLTPAGLAHPLFRFADGDVESNKIFSNLKPLFWNADGYVRKLSAEVLAVHPERMAEGATGENHPLVLQQFSGSGRVIFFGFDETWRWRFRRDEEHYNRFWRQVIRTLSRNRVSRLEIKTDKQTSYLRDEPIRVTVRFPDDAPAPEATTVKVRIERAPLRFKDGSPPIGDTEAQTMPLSKVEGSRGTYQGTLARTPEGEYRFRLTEPEWPGTAPKAEAKVLPPPGERTRLEMNVTDMARAAAESRGKFYTLLDYEKLLDELPETTRLPLNQPCPPVPIWNHAGLYALLLLLFAVEWVLRKRERLL